MSDAYVIDVQGSTVGIATAEEAGFVFFAANPMLHALEGALFPSLVAIEKAARQFLKSKHRNKRLRTAH